MRNNAAEKNTVPANCCGGGAALMCSRIGVAEVAALFTNAVCAMKLNPNLAILGMRLTMFDIRNRLSKDVMDEINRCMPRYLLKTYIPRNVRLSEAPSHGKSIIHYEIKSKGATAYLNLAQEVLTRKPTP